tara:strand:+ start:564 stop:743 length:180 start_codon:yes stop_codon:yes gene_type:complete
MKNKRRHKKKLTFQQFNRMINQFLTELGDKRRKKLEEQQYLQLLTENEDFTLRIKRRIE